MPSSATPDSEYVLTTTLSVFWPREVMLMIWRVLTEGNQDIWRLVGDTDDAASTRQNQVYIDTTGTTTDWDITPGNFGFWDGSTSLTQAHFGDKSFIAMETTDEYPGGGRMQILLRVNGTTMEWMANPDSTGDAYDPTNTGTHPSIDPGGWTHVPRTLGEDNWVPAALGTFEDVSVGVNNKGTYSDGQTTHAIPVFTILPSTSIFAYYFGGYVPAKPLLQTKPHLFLSGTAEVRNLSQSWNYVSVGTNNRCRMVPGYPPYTRQLDSNTIAQTYHWQLGNSSSTVGQEPDGDYVTPNLVVSYGINRTPIGMTEARYGIALGSIALSPGTRDGSNLYHHMEGLWFRRNE